jgi:galactonate dehydratase
LGAVREAVGLDVDIGVEIHRKLVPADAIALAQYLLPMRIFFYEDPILHDSVDSHAEVAQKVNLPIAVGERHHTIYEFRDLLARNAVHYVRPDVGLAGGLTHCKKIATVAESYHAGVIPHNFLSPLLTAASVQLAVAIPNFVLQEYNIADEQPPKNEMLVHGLPREGGYIITPEEPGLGVEVNEGFIEKHPFKAMDGQMLFHEDGSVAYH